MDRLTGEVSARAWLGKTGPNNPRGRRPVDKVERDSNGDYGSYSQASTWAPVSRVYDRIHRGDVSLQEPRSRIYQ